MNNYRTIKIPDCCAVCKYYEQYVDLSHTCNKNKPKKETDLNGLCNYFERED